MQGLLKFMQFFPGYKITGSTKGNIEVSSEEMVRTVLGKKHGSQKHVDRFHTDLVTATSRMLVNVCVS